MGPDFLIVGAAKAGTTSLYEVLSHHPQISLSSPKRVVGFHGEASAGAFGDRDQAASLFRCGVCGSRIVTVLHIRSTSTKRPCPTGWDGQALTDEELMPISRFKHPWSNFQNAA
ncbi:hypothetical protein [Acuticoccus yangtzensis]|uniref:hypothetical protein n=1 Tax=Acuticoccus yangtzensis TaxID=1443441 RepID=UPI00196A69F3|nr:hypothetical protein [Acuticoccus yangtzensis]